MSRKKITNQVSKKTCAIRQRTVKHGRKGQIKGPYKTKKSVSAYVKRNFGDVIRKLAKE